MARPRRHPVFMAQLARREAGPGSRGVVRSLRDCLLEGRVPPGTPIPLDDVASWFGVSRIPVREALKTLIGEGLVDHEDHSGYQVARITLAEFRELYIVRHALEEVAMQAAATLATAEDQQAAVTAHEDLHCAVDDNDAHGYNRSSREFHLALAAPCRMRRVLHMLEQTWNITELIQPMAHVSEEGRAHLHDDHAEMLEAFLRRDAPALLDIGREHHERLMAALDAVPTDTGLFGSTD